MAYAVGQIPVGFSTTTGGDVTDDGAKTVVIPIPTFPGPDEIPWERTWVTLAADHGSAKIRVAVFNNKVGDWHVTFVNVDRAGGPVGLDIRHDDSIVSLARMPQGDGDTQDRTPVSWIVQAVLSS